MCYLMNLLMLPTFTLEPRAAIVVVDFGQFSLDNIVLHIQTRKFTLLSDIDVIRTQTGWLDIVIKLIGVFDFDDCNVVASRSLDYVSNVEKYVYSVPARRSCT